MNGNFSAPVSILSTARSVRSSASTTVASNSRRSASATVISSAPLMTWWLVTMSPLASTMTPEPSELCTRSRVPPKGKFSPKKRRKKGSSKSGDTARERTTLRL